MSESDILSKRTIARDEARSAASRLIAGAFRRDGERLGPEKRPRFSIPAKPDADDDLVVCAYIEQAAARLATLEAALGEAREMLTPLREMAQEAPSLDSNVVCKVIDIARIDAALSSSPPGMVVVPAGLRTANAARQAEWDQDNQISLTYRATELAGEVGEACNIIKKLEREKLGIRGSRATKQDLADELADVVICADLIAMGEGIDLLGEAVPTKFNATSDKYGLQTHMLAASPAQADRQT